MLDTTNPLIQKTTEDGQRPRFHENYIPFDKDKNLNFLVFPSHNAEIVNLRLAEIFNVKCAPGFSTKKIDFSA